MKKYFTNIPIGYPENRDNPHWQNGVEMCDWWLRLQEEQDLQQAKIDAFLKRHRADASRGSAWMDLEFQFRNRARAKGFQAWVECGSRKAT